MKLEPTQKRKSPLIRKLSYTGSLLVLLGGAQGASAQWTFNTCGADGRLGPDQAACNTAYSSTTLQGAVTVTGGIQRWTVPATGQYLIEADGAAGGTQQYTGSEGNGVPSPGGYGASMQGTFNLSAGQIIYILVGQKGGDTREDADTGDDWESAAPGGGGGTFVYLNASDALPLLAAGGGGSGSNCPSINTSLQNAATTTSGHTGQNIVDGAVTNGGTPGNGGRSNYSDDSSSYWAGGGGGWLTDGTGGFNQTDYDPAPDGSGAYGGLAPRNGGTGGLRWDDSDEDDLDEGGDGGFGGGGGGGSDNMGGGGGGGFAGGGGADGSDCESDELSNNPGGGGGSYNGGANPSNGLAASRSDGIVTIRALGEAPAATPVPTLSTLGGFALMLVLGLFGMVALRRQT